jgi:hypothetical protein
MSDEKLDSVSRRDALRTGTFVVGASLGLVGTSGTASAADVVDFEEPLTITAEDSGTTFRQVADIDTEGVAIELEGAVDDVDIDGNGYTITGGSIRGGLSGEQFLTDLEIRNVHLDGSGMFLESIEGLALRNNVVDSVDFAFASDVHVVDNTVLSGGISYDENVGDTRIVRNVTSNVTSLGDLGGTHRIAHNVVLADGPGAGIGFLLTTPKTGVAKFVGNYITGADGPGVELENVPFPVKIAENAIVGNGQEGVRSNDDANVRELKQNAFVGNGGSGVATDTHIARDNLAAANDGDGFDIGSPGYVLDNLATGNGGDGFVLGGDGEVERNVATGNDGVGFRLDGLMNARVKSNRSTANGTGGVVLEESERSGFRQNIVTANGGDGVALVAAIDNDLTANNVCANAGEAVFVDEDSDGNRLANNVVC